MTRWTATIEALRRAGEAAAADRAARDRLADTRLSWVRQAVHELADAQHRADEAWDRALAALAPDTDDAADDAARDALPAPPEQADVDRRHAELDAVRTRDLWPWYLYLDEV